MDVGQRAQPGVTDSGAALFPLNPAPRQSNRQKQGLEILQITLHLYAKLPHHSHLGCPRELQQQAQATTQRGKKKSWCRGSWGEMALHCWDVQQGCTEVS